MARIAGVDIPNEKRVVISLQYIYGIGETTAENLLKNAETVIQKGFLNPEKPKSSYNEDDVDTSLEEAVD